MERVFHCNRLHPVLCSRFPGRIDFELFSKSPKFKNSMDYNFARFFVGVSHCFVYDDQRRFTRFNWCVGFSTNTLGFVYMVGRDGWKLLGEEMIIVSYPSYATFGAQKYNVFAYVSSILTHLTPAPPDRLRRRAAAEICKLWLRFLYNKAHVQYK